KSFARARALVALTPDPLGGNLDRRADGLLLLARSRFALRSQHLRTNVLFLNQSCFAHILFILIPANDRARGPSPERRWFDAVGEVRTAQTFSTANFSNERFEDDLQLATLVPV